MKSYLSIVFVALVAMASAAPNATLQRPQTCARHPLAVAVAVAVADYGALTVIDYGVLAVIKERVQ
ncbi:hypothetical protein EV182_003622, partial [Spiromyces aspiralis]